MRVTTLTRYGVQATMIGLLGGLSGCFMPSLGTGFENSTFFSSNSEDTSAQQGVPCSNEAPPSSLSSSYAVRCASCHGNEGEGGVYKSLRGNLSESAYISVIRGGRGAMPPFNAGQISDAELRSDYLYLHPLPMCPSPVPSSPSPSSTPTVTPSATPAPSATPTSTPSPLPTTSTETFVQAVKLNDPNDLVLDGVNFAGYLNSSVSNTGHEGSVGVTLPAGVTLKPATDEAHAKMFSRGIKSPPTYRVWADVPNGLYHVYLYVFEDDAPTTVKIVVQGLTVENAYSTGPAGTWAKLGPYVANVTNGRLMIENPSGSLNLSAYSIYRVSGAATPAPTATVTPQPTATSTPSVCATMKAKGVSTAYTNNCSVCHGTQGNNGPYAKFPGALTESAFISVVRSGRSPMPAYPASAISDADLKADWNYFKNYRDVTCPDPTPISTATPAPVSPSGVPAVGSLVRAVNFNGSALVFGGKSFEAGTASGVSISGGGVFENQAVALNPNVSDANQAKMIRSSIWGSFTANVSLRNANYDVYVYVWEDNNSEPVSLQIQGANAFTNRASGSAGAWARLGPYAASVTNGALTLKGTGGALNLSGVEVFYKSDNAASPVVIPETQAFKSFRNVIAQNCMGCHGPGAAAGDFAKLQTSVDWEVSEYVIPGDILESRIYHRLAGSEGPAATYRNMPQGGRLSDADLKIVKDYILSLKTNPGCTTAAAPVFQPIRRLNVREYNNSVRDLLGYANAGEKLPPTGVNAKGFDTSADYLVASQDFVRAAHEAAEMIADKIAASSTLPGVLSGYTGSEASLRQTIVNLIGKAYRRGFTTTSPEVTALVNLANSVGGTNANRISAVVSAVLTSPNFLFVVEPDANRGTIRSLNSYEIAGRLALFIWSSVPDDTLLSLASQNQLVNDSVIRTQVLRMLSDVKGREFTIGFGGQLLALDKTNNAYPNAATYPKFSDSIRNAMVSESLTFFHSLIESNASTKRLVDANYTYLNSDLSSLYQISGGGANSSTFSKVTYDQSLIPRSGVLTQGSIMLMGSGAYEGKPTARGLWVLDRLLCMTPKPAPIAQSVETTKATEGLTGRQLMELHAANPNCAGCHRLMDPIGFALSAFDAIGVHRKVDALNRPIDTTGVIFDKPFRDTVELGNIVASRPELNRCLTTMMYSYAVDVPKTTPQMCTVNNIAKKVSDSGKDGFVDLITEVVLGTAKQRMSEY